MTYESSNRGERITYEVREGVLHASSDSVAISVDLRARPVTQKRRRVYSRWFRVGVVGFFFSSFTLTMIASKDGVSGLGEAGPYGLLHCAFILAGLILIVLFRRPVVVTEIASGSDGIAIWKDSAKGESDRYQIFTERVAEEIKKAAEPGATDNPDDAQRN